MIEYLAYLPLLLLLVPAFYLAIPLLILFGQKMPAHPKFKVLDLHKVERGISKYLISQTEELFRLGFEEPTLLRIPDPVPDVTAYMIMAAHRKAGDKAMVTVLLGHGGDVTLKNLYLEFSTRFDTGEVYDTMNSHELSAFPLGPTNIRTQTPSVTDPAELYRLHTHVMQKHTPAGKKTLYEPGKALEYLTEYVFIHSYDEQVKRGWLRYDKSEDCYRPTIKGAYLMTWGLLPPFKAIRQAAMRRREKRILAEFE